MRGRRRRKNSVEQRFKRDDGGILATKDGNLGNLVGASTGRWCRSGKVLDGSVGDVRCREQGGGILLVFTTHS